MTDKEKLEAIKAEIEIVVNRRLNLLNGDYFDLNKEANGFTNEIMSIINSMQEEPKKCMFTKDSYTDEDRKVLCEDCKEKCEYSKKEEPVSEDLEEAMQHNAPNNIGIDDLLYWRNGFIAGAKWQKEHLWKPADGDDLPIIDREVIAILDYDFGHYKVVYAHRPNPNGWNGTNIDTGEEEHFEPATYGKGGWNQPHILYWLDTRLPYEENKITKQE